MTKYNFKEVVFAKIGSDFYSCEFPYTLVVPS